MPRTHTHTVDGEEPPAASSPSAVVSRDQTITNSSKVSRTPAGAGRSGAMDRRTASNAQVGRLWKQGKDEVWRGCLYGVYGWVLGKTIKSHAFQTTRNGQEKAARPVSLPGSLPNGVHGYSTWLSSGDMTRASVAASIIADRASPNSSSSARSVPRTLTSKQDVSTRGLDLNECEAVYPATLEGVFEDLAGDGIQQRPGFTVLEKNGHTHTFGVASVREQRIWIETIERMLPADSTCAAAPVRKQCSEALPFRSEWRESLSTQQLQDGGGSESCGAALDQTNEVGEHATQRAVAVSPVRSVPPVHEEQAPMHASRDGGARNTNKPSGDEELQNKLTAAEQQVRQLKIQVIQEKEEANLMREMLAALQTKLDVRMRELRQATPKEAAKTLRAEVEALKAREDAMVAHAKAERELREEADKTRKEAAASAEALKKAMLEDAEHKKEASAAAEAAKKAVQEEARKLREEADKTRKEAAASAEALKKAAQEEADKTRNEAVTSAEAVKKAAQEEARKLLEEAKNEVGDRMQVLTLKAQLEDMRQQLSKQMVWARTKMAKQAPLQAAAEKLVRQMREVQDQAAIACDHASMFWQDQHQKSYVKDHHIQDLQCNLQRDQQTHRKIIEELQKELSAAKRLRQEETLKVDSLKACHLAELKLRDKGFRAMSEEVCLLKAEIYRLKKGHLENVECVQSQANSDMNALQELRRELEESLKKFKDEKVALEVELLEERKTRKDEVKAFAGKIETLSGAADAQRGQLEKRIRELSFQLRLARDKKDSEQERLETHANKKEFDELKGEIARLSDAKKQMLSVFEGAHPVVSSLCHYSEGLERTLNNIALAFAALQLELQHLRALQTELQMTARDRSKANSLPAASLAQTPPVVHRKQDETSWLQNQTQRIRSATKSRIDCWPSPPATPHTPDVETNKKHLTAPHTPDGQNNKYLAPHSGCQMQLTPTHCEVMAARERARMKLFTPSATQASTPNPRIKKADDSSPMQCFRAAARAKLRR